MEIIKTTKEQIAKAFEKWNNDVVNNPELFDTEMENSAEKSEMQADTLCGYLTE